MSVPLASIVIPVFNGMPYLPVTLDSVLAQDYPNLEIVLVDGGSTDDSLPWLRTQTDPRIRLHELPRGTPAATTWTVACERSRGEFVKMMGQDDLLRSDAISSQVSALTQHPGAGMASGLRDIIAADGTLLRPKRGRAGLKPGSNPGADALRCCYLHGTNVIGEPFAVLFRREALINALPWSDTRPLLLDLDLYTTVLQHRDLVTQPRVIGAFRVSASSWSTRIAAQQRVQFRSWQHDYEQRHPNLSSLVRARARCGMLAQTTLRRAAYQWLRMRGRMGDHQSPKAKKSS